MLIEKTLKEIDSTHLEITLVFEGAEFETKYSEELQKNAKEAVLPGFRKGKVPLNILENKIGKFVWESVLYNEFESKLNDVFKELDDRDRPIMTSKPVLSNEDEFFNTERGSNVKAVLTYEIMPRFDLPQYTGLDIEVPSIVVTDKDIEEKIEEYRQSNAIIKKKDDKDVANESDIVTIDSVETDESGKTVDDRKDYTFPLLPERAPFDSYEEIKGMSVGETKSFDRTIGDGKFHFDVTVKEIKERILPEVDDEFAEDIKEEWKTVKDMRDGIKAGLEEEAKEILSDEERDIVLSKILGENKFTVTKSLVDVQIEDEIKKMAQNYGLTVENFEQLLSFQGRSVEEFKESMRTPVEDVLRKQLLIVAIRDKEGIKGDPEQVTKQAEEILSGIEDKDKRDDFEKFVTLEIEDKLSCEAVLPWLKEHNNMIKKDSLSLSEYRKQTEEQWKKN